MLISYEWLRDYVEITESPADVAAVLTRIGLAVEALHGAGDDAVLDVEVTTNRPDCLGHIGVAREFAVATGRPLSLPDDSLDEDGEDVSDLASLSVESPRLCPRYTAGVIRGVRLAESPDWLKRRLSLVGLRPINNIVDITNFVLCEYSQPLHSFDLDLVSKHRVIVRESRDNELIVLLDGSEVRLGRGACVIADPVEAIALAGIMGGANSEINSSTSDVLMESASFDPVSIRRTARALGLSTEASYRFERGVDPVAVRTASRRALHLIRKLAGGSVARGMLDSCPDPFAPAEVVLAAADVSRLLGMDVPPGDVQAVVSGLGCSVSPAGEGSWKILNPSWRPDLTRPADYVEEVVRILGFDRVPATVGLRVSVVRRSPRERVESAFARFLPAAGFNQVLTDSFLTENEDSSLLPWGSPAPIRVLNPVRDGQDVLRRSITPSLLNVCRHNLNRGIDVVRIFESGPVYLRSGNPLPDEAAVLGVLSTEGLREVKGAVQGLFDFLRAPAPAWKKSDVPGLARGNALVAGSDGRVIGVMGVLSPAVSGAFDLRRPVAVAELRLDALVDRSGDARFAPLDRFPSVTRDVAVVVDESVPWETVDAAVRDSSPPLLAAVRFLETYRGGQTGPGRKSFAFQMVYRSPERTLTDEEVNSAHAAFLDRFLPAVRGTLRA
ncbi:MAG: phenylalanine--tRNA ligase subunit beta [Planctomycetes bacterium]|nr:phenylalanine--tRNA ligase subunit beta [Planctomycetota bacterium]